MLKLDELVSMHCHLLQLHITSFEAPFFYHPQIHFFTKKLRRKV